MIPFWIVVVAMLVFYVAMLDAGPIRFEQPIFDLDLGAGISIAPDGEVKVKNPVREGPVRLPEEAEYNGISTEQ